jgi:magnesium-transporting ATPase (P-type)
VATTNVTALVAMAGGLWSSNSLDGRRPRPRGDDPTPWHALAPEDVLREAETSPGGLSTEAASTRPHDNGGKPPPSFGSIFASELVNPLSAVLAAGGALSTVAGSLTDGVLITGVLGLNAGVGALQRLRTERAVSRMQAALVSTAARVRRDDSVREIAPSGLVRGDLIVLQAGDVVPADARIVDAAAVEADESALTGESIPVAKSVDPVAPDAAVADRASIVYAGTAIAAGRADAVVIATGDGTEAKRGIDDIRAPVTGVEARLDDLTRKTIPITLAAGGLLIASSIVRGVAARDAIATGVSLAAAAVPEGLPFLATVAQSAAARRLSTEGVLVRNPRVLEALGRVDVLCFDKTGTLTEGMLAVRSVSDGKRVQTMPVIDPRPRGVLAAAARATPRRRRERLPHPTDQAIVDAAEAARVTEDVGASGWHKTTSLPFSSERGYHAALGRADGERLLTVKGAPEVVLPRCTRRRTRKGIVDLDARRRRKLDEHVAELAGQGLRVLAVAERRAAENESLDDEDVADLDLLGFVTVADVTRASAGPPIAELQRNGIAVVMLTGDHPQTAEAIGRELGLVNGGVVTGTEIDDLDDDRLDQLLEHATVFARVTPAHKVRIVSSYRRLGRVVAMTGDGANDAQAIRLADTGIAFGPHATAAAREAADLVIVDDRIETLIAAIIEGRSMWASVRDALALLLGGNLGETIFTTGAGLVAGRSPLNARQLLAVNLLTDLAPAIAIALQRPVDRIDLRREGPETSLGFRLTTDIAIRAGATAAAATCAWTAARLTGTPTHASTVALAALVGTQLGQTVVVGYRSPLVLASTTLSAAELVGIVQLPGINNFFGCRPLGPIGWSIAATSAVLGTGGALLASRVVHRDRGSADSAPRSLNASAGAPHCSERVHARAS